jgi:parallel beta-helix repeat protein
MKTVSAWVVASFLLVACGGSSESSNGGAPGGSGATGGSSGAPAIGSGGTTGAGGSTSVGAVIDETLCGDNIVVTAAKTIAVGTTTAICAGTTVTFPSGTSLAVLGTLLIQGTADKPVKLVGTTAAQASWNGVIVAAAGNLVANYVEIHGARTGVDARARSNFQIDHILVDTSAELISLASDGTIAHGAFHGLGDQQQASPVLISGSPRITDTVIDKGEYGGIDIIVISGAASAPVFDHVEVADSHCGFHVNDGSGITITNSNIHHNAFAMMLEGSQNSVFTHNNFQDNTFNLGSCAGATANAQQNYFAGSPVDGSCTSLTIGTSAAAVYSSDVGPRP